MIHLMASRDWMTRSYAHRPSVPTGSGWMIRVMADGDAATRSTGAWHALLPPDVTVRDDW